MARFSLPSPRISSSAATVSGRFEMAHFRSSFDTIAALLVSALTAGTAAAQQTQTQTQPFEPQVGQAGKDVVWVPTAEALVEKMLDLAKITPQDVVMDLGSG